MNAPLAPQNSAALASSSADYLDIHTCTGSGAKLAAALAASIPDFSRPVVPQFRGLADLDGVPVSGEPRLFHRLQIHRLP